MLVATEVRNLTGWKKDMITNAEILELNHDDLLAPGFRVRAAADGTQLWVKRLANGDVAAMLLNAGDAAAADIAVAAADVGWPAGASFAVRNLWTHVNEGVAQGSFAAAGVPPHGNALLRLKKSA